MKQGSRWARERWFWCIALSFSAALSVQASQNDIRITASAGALYDTNRELRSEYSEELTGAIAQAGLRYTGSNERSSWVGGLKLTEEQFPGRGELENDSLNMTLSTEVKQEKSRLTGDVGLLSDTTLANEVQASGAVRDRKDRLKGSAAVGYEYSVTARDWIMGGVSAESVDYEDILPGAVAEYDYYGGNLAYGRALAETTTLQVAVFESHSSNDDAGFENDVRGIKLSWLEQLDETSQLTVAVGARRAWYRQEVQFLAVADGRLVLLSQEIEHKGDGTVYELGWSRQGEYVRTGVNASLDLTPDSAGSLTDRRQATFTAAVKWSETAGSALDLTYWDQRSEIENQTGNDTRGYHFTFSTRWQLRRNLQLECRLQRLERELTVSGETADTNRFLLQMVWSDDPISF